MKQSGGIGRPSSMHIITQCPCLKDSTIPLGVSQYLDWKHLIKYRKPRHQKICYFCHVPQLDSRLHGDFVANGSGCIHSDIIIPTIIGVYYQWRGHAESNFGVQWESLNTFRDWLLEKPIVGYPSNIVALFIWFVKQSAVFS
jgi:hypothetical protein